MMTRHASTLSIVVAVAVGLLVPTTPIRSASPDLARLDSYINHALDRWETPGLAIAIVKDDQVALAKGLGVRELHKPERVDADTLFGIGSCSKAFAAVTIASLVDQHKLSWEDRVVDILPWFELYDPWVTHEVRINDLVTHRVGTDFIAETKLRPVSSSARDLLHRARHLAPSAPFRQQFVYSNNMFIAAGQVVAAVSGKSWPDFARQTLWRPLGMNSTTASTAAARESANHATPHMLIDRHPVPVRWEYPDSVAVPAGGINSSAHDMAAWMRFQLGNGRFRDRQLVAGDVFRVMHSPQTIVQRPTSGSTRVIADPEFGSRFWSYGMGWYVNEFRGRKMVWHTGSIDGFKCVCALLPEDRLGVTVLINGDRSTLPLAVALQVFDTYIGNGSLDWSEKLLADANAQDDREAADEGRRVSERLQRTHPSLPLTAYTGTYVDEAFGTATVAVERSALTMRLGELRGTLVHWHLDTFRTELTWGTHPFGTPFVNFQIDSTGSVAKMQIDQLALFVRDPSPRSESSFSKPRVLAADVLSRTRVSSRLTHASR